MDPNTIIEALRGTMDPALREAAERQLNEVRTPGWRRRAGGLCQAKPSGPGQRRGRRRGGARLEGWGGDLTASATPGRLRLLLLLLRWWRRPRLPLRRILSWASGCGRGTRSRLRRGGRDRLDTWLGRVADRLLAHSSLVPRAQEGAKLIGRFFRRFREQSLWRRVLEGLLGM